MEVATIPQTDEIADAKLFDLRADPSLVANSLFDDFVVPPFSTLDTRQGYWQERSRQWLSLGIKSEIGRNKGLTYGKFNNPDISAFSKRFQEEQTSIFDPVLTEIMYRWFAPKHAVVLDPFAGGSVRGVVAAALGHNYIGIELRKEQVAANREQAEVIFANHPMAPTWIDGDALSVLRDATYRPCACHRVGGCATCSGRGWYQARFDIPRADLLLTCHPSGTMVTTPDGLSKIEDIAQGDLVFTHKGTVRRVTDVLKRDYCGQMNEIYRRYSNVPVISTATHLLLVKRDSLVSWRYAKDIRPGDFLVEPVPSTSKSRSTDGQVIWEYQGKPKKPKQKGRVGPRVGYLKVQATKEAARLVGYYLAEGSTSGGGFDLAFGPSEDALITDTIALTSKVLGLRAVERPPVLGNRVRVVGGSGITGVQFFRTCGRGAANKHFPLWLWDCSDDILREAIRGAWLGDGWHCTQDGDIGFGSVSRQLADDMRRGLLRLGIVASLSKRHRGENLPMWTLGVRGEFADQFRTVMELDGIQVARRPGRSPHITGRYVCYQVERNETFITDEPITVHNMDVEVDHSYIAEGVVSHNCPPYADLEIYSDDPLDLSNMPPDDFDDAYTEILWRAVGQLHDDRFAAIVIGNIRDKSGRIRELTRLTIDAMAEANCGLYNELILQNSTGTAAVRARKQMDVSRKIVKLHQTVLVFVRGDARKAAEYLGPIGTE